MDVFDHLKNSAPSQSRVQNTRRRMNQRPAIHRAQVTADDGVTRGSAAQQRADEAHSRFTNTALDAAHVRADAAHSRTTNNAVNQAHAEAEKGYKKSGVEPADVFKCDRLVGAAQAAFLRHAPADGDAISVAQTAGGSLIFFNDTTAKELLRIDRTGIVTFPGGTLSPTGNLSVGNVTSSGFVEQTDGLRPNFTGIPTTLAAGTAGTYSHNFGAFPKNIEAFRTLSAGVRAPLPFGTSVFVESYTINQITIRNNGTQSWEVGCFLWK